MAEGMSDDDWSDGSSCTATITITATATCGADRKPGQPHRPDRMAS